MTSKKVKALLSNTFIFPGIGQLILGDNKKGVLLIVLSNIILLLFFVIFLKIALPFLFIKIRGELVNLDDLIIRLKDK